MIELIRPNTKYFNQYKEMMDEWHEDGSRIAPWPLYLEYNTEEKFMELVNRLEEVEKGINLNDMAPLTTYWLYDEEKDRIMGATCIRHKVLGENGRLWGHIGYGVRPSERRKGYATYILKTAMKEAQKRDIKYIYVGAYTENIASCKTIEKCGFDFDEHIIDKGCDKEIRKYYYSFKRKYANSAKDMKNVEEIKQKIISVNESDFCGDIYLNHFIKVKEPCISASGVCYLNNGYKWLEFYDYSLKHRLTAIYDDNNQIVEWYYDISRKIGKENGIPYEDDMYLDVVVTPNGRHILLDEDELKNALERDEITERDYINAIKEAENIINEVDGRYGELKKFSDKYLKKFF